jgi:hypothetical protein
VIVSSEKAGSRGGDAVAISSRLTCRGDSFPEPHSPLTQSAKGPVPNCARADEDRLHAAKCDVSFFGWEGAPAMFNGLRYALRELS